MAGNVSGNPVTDDIVRLIYPDVKDVTPQLRAKVAFQYMNAEGRDVNCKNFVHNLKQRYGNGISALCMLFNATGSSLTYVGYRDWHGHIYESPYPSAYTEIREAKHYETDHWDYIKGLLEAKSTYATDTWSGCYSAVTIGQGTSPEFVGIMSLDGIISERSAATLITLAADSATEDKEDKE
ncbi:hypothetical protein FNV43_RR08475 [Rhamnella rubrinervis]|uniref:Uncharacterized protein n=1 Tax=Rhamnella rubrinervis TaxID=2594499 RepID=A0A8K0MIZ4_9ROSA|nr:hypothetical protein FNV43_RR08475 [Rhamnella rubrinervis]